MVNVRKKIMKNYGHIKMQIVRLTLWLRLPLMYEKE